MPEARMSKAARISKHEDSILPWPPVPALFSCLLRALRASAAHIFFILLRLRGLSRLHHWQAAACQCHPDRANDECPKHECRKQPESPSTRTRSCLGRQYPRSSLVFSAPSAPPRLTFSSFFFVSAAYPVFTTGKLLLASATQREVAKTRRKATEVSAIPSRLRAFVVDLPSTHGRMLGASFS